MKTFAKISAVAVCIFSMNFAYGQESSTTISPTPPLPAQQTESGVSKQGETKQAPAAKKSTRSKSKTAATAPAPEKTASDKAPDQAAPPANTGAGESKEAGGGAAPAPKTRMAISEQGIPAEKPKTSSSPTTAPKAPK